MFNPTSLALVFSALQFLLVPSVRADISPTEIAGLYDRFKDGYKHLSPVNALLTLRSGVLSNVRFRGNYSMQNPAFLCHRQITHPAQDLPMTAHKDCPQDNTTAILQHFFPSPAGTQLSISNAESDFFKHITIEQIGGLLDVYTTFKNSPQLQSKLKTRLHRIKGKFTGKAGAHIAEGWKHIAQDKVPDALVEHYAKMLAGAQEEAVSYPHAFVETAFLALALKKATKVDDLAPLLKALEKYQKTSKKIPSQFSRQMYSAFEKEGLVNNKIKLEYFDALLKTPEKLIFHTLLYDLETAGFAETISTSWATFKGVSFSDCGESALRGLFNLLLGNPVTRQFDSNYLRDAFPDASLKLFTFFTDHQRTYDEVQNEELHSLWAEVVSDLNTAEGPKIAYSQSEGSCNIRGIGIDNILLVIEKLLNDKNITKIRETAATVVQARKEIVSYVLQKFCRDDFIIGWHAEDDRQIDDEYVELVISINNEDKFQWSIQRGHFQFFPISSVNASSDWRKNNENLLLKLLEEKSTFQALIPFYFSPAALSQKLTNDTLQELGNSILYGLNLNGGEQLLSALNIAAHLNIPSALTLAARWLESLPDDNAMNKKMAYTVFNLGKLKGWNELFSQKRFPKAFLRYEKALNELYEGVKKSTIDDFNSPWSENLLMHFLQTIPVNDLLNETSQQNGTLLHAVASAGFIDSISLLWTRAPQLFSDPKLLKNVRGDTPLHYAISMRQTKTAGMLLKHSPNLIKDKDQAINHNGLTPYHLAAMLGDSDVLELLLAYEPKMALVKDKQGETALHKAARVGPLKSLQLLLSQVPALLSIPMLSNKDGITPLHYAIMKMKYDKVLLLIEAVPDLAYDTKMLEEGKKTALVFADENLMPNGDFKTSSQEIFKIIAAATPRSSLEKQLEKITKKESQQMIMDELSKINRPVDAAPVFLGVTIQ